MIEFFFDDFWSFWEEKKGEKCLVKKERSFLFRAALRNEARDRRRRSFTTDQRERERSRFCLSAVKIKVRGTFLYSRIFIAQQQRSGFCARTLLLILLLQLSNATFSYNLSEPFFGDLE